MHIQQDFSLFKKTVAMLAILALIIPPVSAPAHEGADTGVNKAKSASSSPSRTPQNPTPPMGSMMKMPVVAPLFVQNEEFSSTLVLVNDSSATTYADVVLTGLDGKEIAKRRVEMAPLNQQRVNVIDLLAAAVSPATTGRITVMQSRALKGMPIAAQLTMTYKGSPHWRGSELNYIDEEVSMPSMNGSQTLRAVSDAGDTSPLISITSLAETRQLIHVECFEESGDHFSKSIELLAEETVVTEACSDRTVHGGDFATVSEAALSEHSAQENRSLDGHNAIAIALTTDSTPGSFASFGLARHGTHEDNYFTAINFTDPTMTLSPNTVFTGAPVGSEPLLADGRYTPEISLANFSANSVRIRVKYSQASGPGTNGWEVRSVIIPGGSTKTLVLGDLQGDPELRNSFVILSDGAPGDVVSKLVSRSQERLLEVELLGRDEKDPTNGGNHPWSLEDGNESTLLLFNHSAEPENFSVSISNGYKTWQKLYELSPMQTEAISFSRLIQEQAKDDRGKTLPRNSLKGQVTWFTRVTGLGKGRLLLSNRDLSMARNFSCASGFALCGLTIYPGTQLFSVGSTVNFGTAQTIICDISGEPQGSCGSNGAAQSCSKCRYAWTSYGAAASISGSNTSPGVSLTGNSAGTSNIGLDVLDTGSACERVTSATATVTPKLQLTLGNQDNSIFVGSDPNLAPPNSIFATVSPTGGTFTQTSSTSGDSFAPVKSGGPGWVVTTTTQSTSNGDRKLTVTYTVSGQNPVSQSLNVTARQFAYATNNSPSNTCTLGYGTKRTYIYTPYTHPDKTAVQAGIGLSGTAVPESFNPQPPAGTVTGGGALDANSQFQDTIAYCSTSPLTISTTVTQTISIEGYQVRQNTLKYDNTGITYTSLGPTQ
jgi:hypothetical protein